MRGQQCIMALSPWTQDASYLNLAGWRIVEGSKSGAEPVVISVAKSREPTLQVACGVGSNLSGKDTETRREQKEGSTILVAPVSPSRKHELLRVGCNAASLIMIGSDVAANRNVSSCVLARPLPPS